VHLRYEVEREGGMESFATVVPVMDYGRVLDSSLVTRDVGLSSSSSSGSCELVRRRLQQARSLSCGGSARRILRTRRQSSVLQSQFLTARRPAAGGDICR